MVKKTLITAGITAMLMLATVSSAFAHGNSRHNSHSGHNRKSTSTWVCNNAEHHHSARQTKRQHNLAEHAGRACNDATHTNYYCQ